jgi:hypothetical protein
MSDPVHTSVNLSLDTWLAPRGTTLDDIRSRDSFRGTRKWPWAPSAITTMRQLGDTFVALPVGKVWRQSVLLTGTTSERSVMRMYWLHQGVARETATGAQEELFTRFTFHCARHYPTGLGNPPPEPPTDQCRTHNGQLAAIMQSLRLTP